MTKQTVYLSNIARKSGCRQTALSQAVCLLNSPLLEKSDNEQLQVLAKGC